MNYTKLYNLIIDNRKHNPIDGYTETHHIIPKSLGGSNDKSNLVELSAREHYICHYLLSKMYTEGTPEWCKMIKAFAYMNWGHGNYHKRYINSRLYSKLKFYYSKVQSINQTGKCNSQYGSQWIYNPELRKTKKIKKTEAIPNGWKLGKIVNFDLYYKKIEFKNNQQKKFDEKVQKLKIIMYYYRDNKISMRELTKKFNVGHNIYKSFELYFKDEYFEIVKTKSNNSNITKGRYK